MTTPHQSLPDPVEKLLGIGAFEIGGGSDGTRFGQNIDEDFVRELVTVPFATFGNMFEVLRSILLKMPIEVLEGMKPFIPDWLEDEILDVTAAVQKILDSLRDREPIATIKEIVEAITGLVAGDLADLAAWANSIPFIQNLADWIVEGITGIPRDPSGTPLEDIWNALRHIPHLNVLGIGGPGSIGESLQATWDQWVAGLVDAPGSTGAALADFFNIGQDVSSRATRGGWAFDITAIRNNRPLFTGFLPSSRSNISLDKIVLTPGTVAITQSTALTAYSIIEESLDIGAISWNGSGVTNVTDCYINIYKMNPTTGVNSGALHASTNQVGLLSASMQQNIYSLSSPVHFDPGEILGVELAIRGAGTHTVLGATNTLVDQAVYPRRWSSVRNSGTSAAPSTTWTPTYSNNVPFIEHAVSAGVVAIPHSPLIVQFNTPTGGSPISYPIPFWASTVDILALGAGGPGFSGSSSYNIDGEGGFAGAWSTTTLTRGIHFSGAASAVVAVGSGGINNGFGGLSGPGSAGGNSSATVSGITVTGAGGIGGRFWVSDVINRNGRSPGNQTLNSVTYVGGVAQSAPASPGSAPGGGGSGGNYFHAGANGANGSVWLRFVQ